VLIVRWISDPHLDLFLPATAAGLLLFALVVVSIGVWRLGEIAIAHLARDWLTNGERGSRGAIRNSTARAMLALLFGLAIAALIALAVWSFTLSWRFPDALPDRWTNANWLREAPSLAAPATTTLFVALCATAIAILLSVLCLENEIRTGKRATKALALLYAPLLIPQVSFLIGAQTLLVRLNLDGGFVALVWAHLLFVLPYVFLALADPWRALDPRYARIAACLGASPLRVFFAVKIPLLLRPLMVAAAIGFAVSAALYLPTLFAGSGRWTSLTTEAVTLASGGDRRVLGVYAFTQAALPLIVYAMALALPAFLYRNRKGMA